MPSPETARAQIAALPSRYIFFTKKEIRALPKLLAEDERILALTSGMMDYNTWLAVCTDRRLLFLHRGMVYGLRQVQVPLERVQSIDNEQGILFGSIRVWDGASYFTLRWVLKSSILAFVRAVQGAMEASRGGGPASGGTDVATQLEKLGNLLERGLLTEAEFREQKKRLLGGAR